MTDSATMGDTAVALAFGDYRPVSGLQLPTRLTTLDRSMGDRRHPNSPRDDGRQRWRSRGTGGSRRGKPPAAAGAAANIAERRAGNRQGRVVRHRHDASQPDRRVQRSSDGDRGAEQRTGGGRVGQGQRAAAEQADHDPARHPSSWRSHGWCSRRRGEGSHRDHCPREQRRLSQRRPQEAAHDQSGHARQTAEREARRRSPRSGILASSRTAR